MEKHESIFLKKSFVVITGSSRGLGKSMALQFGGKFPPDSVLVLMARNVEALESVRTDLIELVPESTVLVKQYDQGNTDIAYFDGIFDNLLAENKLSKDDFDQVVVVHNCATTGDNVKTALQLCDANHVRSYYDINLVGMILLNTSFFTTFSDSAKSRVVINITSGASQLPAPSLHLYCAGKAARDMFFRVLATEEPSIRILTYAPGAVDTEMLRDLETNASSAAFRKVLNDLRKDDKLKTSAEAVTDLIYVLEDNTFDNAVFVNNYEQTAKPYIEETLFSNKI
ncbi:sepiapterin reductase-like [Mizuhopecten yessoensis]|uniref:Sepiapterin reductase n=1 Tax=Mizuhopecten yessoensis TaxID=6573 RepID=A0A210PT72_MIZYE|nr:sepiapterin reductase-like [Mizuhopecten yessoensis]OWF39683.1 Sepiapterin reductase [Mizuhopecten yessoensis]